MNLIYAAVVLGLLAALLDWFIGGIAQPWRKIIFYGLIIMFVVGLILIFLPGIFSFSPRFG